MREISRCWSKGEPDRGIGVDRVVPGEIQPENRGHRRRCPVRHIDQQIQPRTLPAVRVDRDLEARCQATGASGSRSKTSLTSFSGRPGERLYISRVKRSSSSGRHCAVVVTGVPSMAVSEIGEAVRTRGEGEDE